MMATGIILVAVMIIVFFLWLIAMEFKGLYDSRAVFNRNVKLMGCPGRKLMMLYILEMLYMQIPCVAGGCVLGAAVYHFYAVGNSEVIVWMKTGNSGCSDCHPYVHSVLTVAIVGRQCVRQSAVTEQRGGYVRQRKKTGINNRSVDHCGGGGFRDSGSLQENGGHCFRRQTLWCIRRRLKLAYMAVVALGFAPVMRLVICDSGCDREREREHSILLISLKLTKSYWEDF